MARGKNSRALFEVITQSQEQKRRAANAPRGTINWFGWLKRLPSADGSSGKARFTPPIEPVMREVPQHDTAPVREEAAQREFTAHREREAGQATDESSGESGGESGSYQPSCEVIDTAATAHESDLYADRVFTPDGNASSTSAYASSDEDEAASASPHDTAITTAIRDDDGPATRLQSTRDDRRALNLTLSYPSLAIAAVALLMLMVVAFVAGRQASSRIALTGPTIEQLQQRKPSPEVLNLKNTPPETTLSRGATEAKPPQANKVEAPPVETAANAQSPAPDRRRVGGRNYIIAQSYPDPDNAEKAAALLQKNNIPVTVEQLDAAPGWFCVVTEVGFDRVSGADCERYQKLVKDLNAQAKTARLKVFEPYLYKWK